MRIFGSLMGIAILVALLLGSGCAPMQLDQGMDMTEKAAKTAEEPDTSGAVHVSPVEIVLQVLELYFEHEGIGTTRDANENLHLQVTDDSLCFVFGKGQLKPKSAIPLRHLAKVLISYPESRLTITGHTDNIGSEEVNLRLSQQRAEAVKGALLLYGVSPRTIVSARGYGKAHPIADNNTVEGRAMNRRVDLRIAIDADEASINQQRREIASGTQ